jgi:ATP-dependent Lhr-like helicase
MQRLGRAGRKTGIAKAIIYVATENESEDIKNVSLDKTLEEQLYLFGNLSLFSMNRVEPIDLTDCYPQIFAHQLISMVYSEKVLNKKKIASLKAAFPFRNLQKNDVQEILEYLEEEQYLFSSGDDYRLGWKAASMLEGVGIGDFLSVFSSSEDWMVMEGQNEIGRVHAATLFHNKQKDGSQIMIQNFFLAGKAWKVIEIDSVHRRILVQRAESGKKPLWLSGEEAMHPVFSHAIRSFLLKPSFPSSCSVDPDVQDALLKTVGNELYSVSFEEPWVPIVIQRKNHLEISLYTYSGELINFVLLLLIKQYSPSYKNVRSTWKAIKWKAYSPFSIEEFEEWLISLTFDEFSEMLENDFSENYAKIYEKVFQDRLIEFVPKAYMVRILLRYFWKLLQIGLGYIKENESEAG